MKRSAIVTGVTGQDGSYLSELLLSEGYKVYGVKRRSSNNGLGCSSHLEGNQNFEVVEADITDSVALNKLCKSAKADHFYNLAAQSHVGSSFEQPEYTLQASGAAVLNCLEAIRQSGIHTRFYQASTSEMFGGQYGEVMCNEDTPFNPRSPYGCAKLYGYHITKNYRESYKMFACSGVLFNHESERRGPNFVTRKITMAIGKILKGEQDKVYLGNLKAKRDWGHAKDFVKGMYMMLNYKQPEDFVLATGETHSVEEFCKIAFDYAGLGDYSKYVEIDPKFYRPAEVDILLGDASKAKRLLGWNPEISFTDLVKMMVEGDK